MLIFMYGNKQILLVDNTSGFSTTQATLPMFRTYRITQEIDYFLDTSPGSK